MSTTMFTVTEQEMLRSAIAIFFEGDDGEWTFKMSTQLHTDRPVNFHSERELAWLLDRGEKPEFERIDIPTFSLADYVDRGLRRLGWKRTSAFRTFPATEPVAGTNAGDPPNRAAECEVRRGWKERALSLVYELGDLFYLSPR